MRDTVNELVGELEKFQFIIEEIADDRVIKYIDKTNSDNYIFHNIKSVNILCSLIENNIYDIKSTDILKEELIKLKDSIYKYKCNNHSSLINGYCSSALAANRISEIAGVGHKITEKLNRIITNHVESKIGIGKINRYRNNSEIYNIEDGLSGTLIYLLSLKGYENSKIILDIIEYLVELTNSIELYGVNIPNWFSYNYENEESIGNFDLGLCNGITGLFLALSLSYSEGIEVPGQIDAINRIAEFIIGISNKNEANIMFWPESITFEEYVLNDKGKEGNKFCIRNGTLGIILALFIWSTIEGKKDVELMCRNNINNLINESKSFYVDQKKVDKLELELILVEKIMNSYIKYNDIKIKGIYYSEDYGISIKNKQEYEILSRDFCGVVDLIMSNKDRYWINFFEII